MAPVATELRNFLLPLLVPDTGSTALLSPLDQLGE
jgi:hypothetical protein